MLLLQVVRARRRGHRARQVLHVRAARLRAGGGLHAAVPGARLRGRHDRAAQLRRGHDPLRPADPARPWREVVVQRAGHPRHAAPGAAADRAAARSSSSPASTSTSPSRAPTATRSFSMANTSSRDDGQLEFVIKVYPDGLFSHFLDTRLAVGDRLELTGPFGVFTLRESHDADLIFVGGGAGMAPILSLLRSMAERGIDRKATYYYGARQPQGPVLRGGAAGAGGVAAELPLRARAVRARRRRRLGRRGRPDHRRGQAAGTSDLTGAHAYVCGPPPMVEAAMPMLDRGRRRREAHLLRQVHHDRLTHVRRGAIQPTGERADGDRMSERSQPKNAACPSRSSPTPRPAPR